MPTQAEVQAARRKSTTPRRKASKRAPAKPQPPKLWPTLGAEVCAWIESYCIHGPGDVRGGRVTLTNEERRFIWRAYEVHPPSSGPALAGRRRWGRAAWVRRKGVRKTELNAWLTLCELLGPVRCAGFDSHGDPIGQPVVSPFIPVAATSLEQSEDTLWGAVYAVASEGPICDHYELDITQLGIIELNTGGEAKPVTASSISRDGGRPTFSPMDETHLWFKPELRRLYDTLMRNLAKRPIAQPWALTTTTAWAPGQGSVAETDAADADLQAAGELPDDTILWDMRSASDLHDLDTAKGLHDAIVEASGDALPWTDITAIIKDFRRGKRAEGERYWLSRPASTATDDSWLKEHPGAFEECREEGLTELDPKGADVAVGIDAALRSDSVAVWALQERPDGTVAGICKTWVSADGRTYDRAALRNYLRGLAKYPLLGIGYDPRYLESDAQDLEDEGLPMVEIPQSPERMVPACLAGYELIVDRALRHDADEISSGQVVAGATREADGGWRLSKGKSGSKIDSGVALCIAEHVRQVVEVADLADSVW